MVNHAWIKDEHYMHEFSLIVCDNEDELLEWCESGPKRKYFKSYGEEIQHDNFNGVLGHTSINRDTCQMAVVFFRDYMDGGIMLEVVGHEIIHLVVNVLDMKGLSLSQASEEAYAYCYSSYYKKLTKELKKWNEKLTI